jgi:hypothetical protein
MSPLNLFELLPLAGVQPDVTALNPTHTLAAKPDQAPQPLLGQVQLLAKPLEAPPDFPPVREPSIDHPAAIETAPIGHRCPRPYRCGSGVHFPGRNLSGKEESAEENRSSRCAKGNKYMRRILNQVAHAAARSKGTHFQAVFRRLLPRLGYLSAIWAIAHRLCRLLWKILHEGVRYVEHGISSEPKLLIHRARYLAKQLRKFGYNVQITPTNSTSA